MARTKGSLISQVYTALVKQGYCPGSWLGPGTPAEYNSPTIREWATLEKVPLEEGPPRAGKGISTRCPLKVATTRVTLPQPEKRLQGGIRPAGISEA